MLRLQVVAIVDQVCLANESEGGESATRSLRLRKTFCIRWSKIEWNTSTFSHVTQGTLTAAM